MNIILLSGGSGKRLWPLSNDTRSKQFLKLMQDEEGNYESMVQRMYRQLRVAGFRENIIVSTSSSQKDAIRSQLDSEVEIVLEPERRNTFPAIVLACAYLAFEKEVAPDEAVVVLPVDPFAELDYFKTLNKMEEAVKSNLAELVLMGIRPTYPSEKYGYILTEPGQSGEIKRVKKFIEKPSAELSKKLIAEGALWNGGVFAFQLGYIIKLLERYMTVDSYEELKSRYVELNKISFDYEVVEKASSVAVVSYNGIWKDLGTWNTLTEEMRSTKIGKVTVGEGAENTHIINELNIPLVVLGAKDLVIAASPDGILVSDKETSSYLRPYVDLIEQRPMFEERRWGEYRVLDYTSYGNDMHSLTKYMFIKAGKTISYQKHALRDEIWTIVNGTGDLLLDGHIRNIRRGDVAYITAGMLHAIRAVTDLHFIEVQIGAELIEEDIERIEYDW